MKLRVNVVQVDPKADPDLFHARRSSNAQWEKMPLFDTYQNSHQKNHNFQIFAPNFF